MCDLIDFRNSDKIYQKFNLDNDKCFIIIFYEPARHRLYLEPLKNKTSLNTSEALKNCDKYLKTLPD